MRGKMKRRYVNLSLSAILAVITLPAALAAPLTTYDPFTGAALFAFTNIIVFLILFWLLNNQRINIDKFIQKYQEGAPKKIINAIKTEIFFKNVGIFAIAILNLTISGFFYIAWTEVEGLGERLAGVYFILNIIIIFALFLLFIIQIFYFPFAYVKESAEMLMEEIKQK